MFCVKIWKVFKGTNKAAEGREKHGCVCFEQIQGESCEQQPN